jgi:hypothetical protein
MYYTTSLKRGVNIHIVLDPRHNYGNADQLTPYITNLPLAPEQVVLHLCKINELVMINRSLSRYKHCPLRVFDVTISVYEAGVT